MITIKEFIEAIEFKITGGSDFGWQCFGPNARYLDSSDSELSDGDYNVSAVFDSVTQEVYFVELWDYSLDKEYRWIDPTHQSKYEAECQNREIDFKKSLDGRSYIDLEVAEDILEKINAVVNGIEYDDRIQVPVDFSDEELLKYMKLAHERDITFNQLVEEALRNAIDNFNAGSLTREDAQAFISKRDLK